MLKNRTLYFGDNLEILREKFPPNEGGYFDLIYLDPPFNSNKNYNILFKEGLVDSPAQVHAFEDSWHWTFETERAFEELTIGIRQSRMQISQEVSDLMLGFEKIIGHNDMMAYLTMMTIRLIELHRVLKNTGTLYLHCDPTASHYLKIVLDMVFGGENFRNEIVWCYAGGGIPKMDFPRKHDIIFRYSKSGKVVYHPQFRPYSEGTQQRGRTQIKGKYFDQGLREEGTPVNDWWTDIKYLHSPTDKEKLGYPTQKSEALLERIIKSSSNKGDWVLDPFCGCGTTVAVAERWNRNWVGIDITTLAINLVNRRLHEQFKGKFIKENIKIEIEGLPKDIHGAQMLFEKDPFEFQYWVLDLINARPTKGKTTDKKRGADEGIDGIITYQDVNRRNEKIYKKLIVSVKGGKNISVKDIRDLKGVIEREKVEGGAFITLHKPTEPMIKEATLAGICKNKLFNREFMKIQIITIDDLLKGKRLETISFAQELDYHNEAPKTHISSKTQQMTLVTT